MLKGRYSYLFPFIDKDVGLSVFIDLTASKGQNLNFHIGQFNYKSHPLPTMLCPLPTFPGSFPTVPPVNSSSPSHQSSWTICIFQHRPLLLSSHLRFPPPPLPPSPSQLSLSPLYGCLFSVFYFVWNVYYSYSAFSITKSCLILLRPCGLQPACFLSPWNFPGKDTGVGCHFLLQGIFLIQRSNPCLLHWQTDSSQLSRQGRPTRTLPVS